MASTTHAKGRPLPTGEDTQAACSWGGGYTCVPSPPHVRVAIHRQGKL